MSSADHVLVSEISVVDLPPLPPPVGGFASPSSPPPPTRGNLAPPMRSAPDPTGVPSQRSPLASHAIIGAPTPAGLAAQKGMSRNGKIAAGGFALLLLVLVGISAIVAQQISALTVVSNLAEGDCVKDHLNSRDGEFTEVLLVSTADCEGQHALEVFAVSESVFSGTEYPGSNEAFALGQEFCYWEFERFVGESLEQSRWEMWSFVPLAGSWAQGDRTVQCLVGAADERSMVWGTLRNSAGRFDA